MEGWFGTGNICIGIFHKACLLREDLGIVADAATSLGVDVPLTRAALAQFEAAVEAGWGKLDDSAVVKVYEARSAVDVAAAGRAAASVDAED